MAPYLLPPGPVVFFVQGLVGYGKAENLEESPRGQGREPITLTRKWWNVEDLWLPAMYCAPLKIFAQLNVHMETTASHKWSHAVVACFMVGSNFHCFTYYISNLYLYNCLTLHYNFRHMIVLPINFDSNGHTLGFTHKLKSENTLCNVINSFTWKKSSVFTLSSKHKLKKLKSLLIARKTMRALFSCFYLNSRVLQFTDAIR